VKVTTALLIIIGIFAAFLLYRYYQRGAHLFAGVIDAPAPIRAAAKRVGFKAQSNVHSIASIHNIDLCITAMALAFTQMDGDAAPCSTALMQSLQTRLQIDPETAADYCTLSPWLIEQGGGAPPAFKHLTKRLKQLDHGPSFEKMMRVLGDMTAAGTKGMPSPAQADAMGALASIFRTC